MRNSQLPAYKAYYGSINIDTENNVLYGKVEFVRAIITYEANDAEGLVQAFHDAVDDYLAFCKEKDIKPEQPFKGSLNVRIGPERHLKTWKAAQSLDKTLNDYICQALDESFAKKTLTPMKVKTNKALLVEKRKSK
jgi:predicted HicB family RNase H-like nuclease